MSGASASDLTWSVDNIAGGDPAVGTISGGGGSVSYLAPAAEGSHLLMASLKGGGSGSSSIRVKNHNVSVTLNPASATVTTGATQVFTASVAGTSNTAVTWSVDGVLNGSSATGTVTGSGGAVTYTAPASAGTHTLSATSVADSTKRASAIITVQMGTPPPAVAVSVSPGAVTLQPGASCALTASVAGTTNTAVTWSVDGLAGGSASAGTISGSGSTVTYVAPSTAGSHSVAATSAADTTKSASAAVTVSASCAPAPASSTTANVKDTAYGAKGDGASDDTAAIQRAVNAIAGTGGTVWIPDGTYMVNALTSIQLKSGMTLSLSSNAVLKAITNGASNYAVVLVSGANHVNITGGTVLGDRATHTGATGEWGMGIQIKGSQQVVVDGVVARDCWGDGFYVASSSSVTICHATGDHNRRQGLTITSVDGMVVRDCAFKNTSGTLPEDGIDFEPNPGETVNNVLITGCTLTGNSGDGIQLGVPQANTGQSWITAVVLDGNTCAGNGVNSLSTSFRSGIEVSNTPGHRIINNVCSANRLGIKLRDAADNLTVSGNTASQNASDGIQVYNTGGNAVTGNTATNNGGHGIYAVSNTSITLSNNTQSGNAIAP